MADAISTTAGRDRPGRRARSRAPFGFSAKAWAFLKVFAASALSSLAFFAMFRLTVDWQPGLWDVGSRLELFIKSAIFAALPAVAAIIVVAVQRLNPDYWTGVKLKPYCALDINTRFVRNTVEQCVLFLIGVSGLALYVTPEDATAIPILAGIFLTGRVLYWIGYHRNTYVRAFGFGLTFYPVAAVYGWLVVRMLLGIYIPI